jgi:hypothetical protein
VRKRTLQCTQPKKKDGLSNQVVLIKFNHIENVSFLKDEQDLGNKSKKRTRDQKGKRNAKSRKSKRSKKDKIEPYKKLIKGKKGRRAMQKNASKIKVRQYFIGKVNDESMSKESVFNIFQISKYLVLRLNRFQGRHEENY